MLALVCTLSVCCFGVHVVITICSEGLSVVKIAFIVVVLLQGTTRKTSPQPLTFAFNTRAITVSGSHTQSHLYVLFIISFLFDFILLVPTSGFFLSLIV